MTENKAWISGMAGRAFVADGDVLFSLRASAKGTPELATPAHLANFLRAFDDVQQIAAGAYPYETVAWDLEDRAGACRCVEFLLAALDEQNEWTLRGDALTAAERLLRNRRNFEFATLLFLNVVPPADAGFAAAKDLATQWGNDLAAALLQRVINAVPEITAFRAAWETFVHGLPEPSLCAGAERFADGARFIARAVRSGSSATIYGDLLSVMDVLDGTPLHDHVQDWIYETATPLKRKLHPPKRRPWTPSATKSRRYARRLAERQRTSSAYEKVFVKVTEGSRFRDGQVYRTIQMKGDKAVFRRSSDGSVRIMSMAELLKRMKDWC